MSRSKRQPFFHIACVKPASIRKYKRNKAKSERRLLDSLTDIPKGAAYKKLLFQWDNPGDGKVRADDQYATKITRK